MIANKRIIARFFRTSADKEPVRVCLKQQTKEDKKSIGTDIRVVEETWPVGFPLVEKLDKDLWEVRINVADGICRIFFTVMDGFMILLHGIIKKTQKTPKKELDLAKKRRNLVLVGGMKNEK